MRWLVYFYFKLFVCPPDIKWPKCFGGYTPHEPPPRPCFEFIVVGTVPWETHLHFTTVKDSIFVKKDVSKTAWKNAWRLYQQGLFQKDKGMHMSFQKKNQKMAKCLKIWANCTKFEDILKKGSFMHATIAHMKQLEYALMYVIF